MGMWVSGHVGVWVTGHVGTWIPGRMGAHVGTMVVDMWMHAWVRGYTGMHAHVHILKPTIQVVICRSTGAGHQPGRKSTLRLPGSRSRGKTPANYVALHSNLAKSPCRSFPLAPGKAQPPALAGPVLQSSSFLKIIQPLGTTDTARPWLSGLGE